ncbi:MAG: IS5/IS1182 family transposase, partial [Methylobacterium organophilum]|nr:IS5/IS1182 family transposase [Methylobacterium organophilum]
RALVVQNPGGRRSSILKGRDRVGWAFTSTAAAYNRVRLPKLLGALA